MAEEIQKKKISELPSAVYLSDTDVLPVVQGTGNSEVTKKTDVGLISTTVAESQQYSNLNTTDKTIVGAINELESASIPSADEVSYDNTSSGLSATDVQGAIDEIVQGGSGGSTVTVTQIQDTGIKIATITVDNVDTDLYAPNGGGGASSLDGLSDVDIDNQTLTNGQTLKYNSTSQKWENVTEGSQSIRFDINASHTVNPTKYDIVVSVGETEVYSHSYSCSIYGVFSETTDTFVYDNETYTITAQGYQANQGQKMLDVSINGTEESVYCSATNSSYPCNDDFFISVSEDLGGHTILDNSGTALEQRPNLQFNGAYSEDNSTDDTTEINVIRSMTKAEFDELTTAEKTGLINITDEISGGLKYVKETLYSNIDESSWSAQSSGDTLTLTDNILDYDEIYFESAFWEVNNSTGKKLTHFVMSMVDRNTIQIAYEKFGSATYDGMFDVCPVLLSSGTLYTFGISMQVPTTTSLKIQSKYVGGWNANSWGITRIIGIKYLSDSEHTYSTDEHIVGTWIDGKTLYEKTVAVTQSPSSETYVSLSGLDIDTFFVESAYIQTTSGDVTPQVYLVSGNDKFMYFYNRANESLVLQTSWQGSGYVTIRYTKSST